MTVSAGEKVTIDASSSTDPDGDGLTFAWFVYPEVGSYKSPVEISHPDSPSTSLHVPRNAVGKDFHVILTLSDDGDPNLMSYRRVIVAVK